MRLCEIRRRIEVWEEEGEEIVTGEEGFEATS
jgi:hypothetical protein